MARITKPPDGRLIISMISPSVDAVADTLEVLEKKFGRVDAETTEIDTSCKDRYREEMGENLYRRFFAFERRVAMDSLADLKSICFKIEPMFADQVGDFIFRTVNIDPGILTPDNLVMTSHRPKNHRIYLRNGIYAEMALIYSQGLFMRLPWTSDDYCDTEAIEFFEFLNSEEFSQEDDRTSGLNAACL
ncbi:MAG: DUF4416 family protein [bacterium]|nr:DUF4416 family protein [bacterium]